MKVYFQGSGLLKDVTNYVTSFSTTAEMKSGRLIGNAISTARKFFDKKEITDPRLLNDFQVVDLSLLESAVESADR